MIFLCDFYLAFCCMIAASGTMALAPAGDWHGHASSKGNATGKQEEQAMRYCFGAYVLDPRRYELQRAGAPQALRPKAFAVLAYLLAHRDRVVTKQELLEQVWPGQFIEETTLAACIMAVRKAPGDSGPTPQVVPTVRSR